MVKSPWFDGSRRELSTNKNGKINYDVIVIGAGFFGLLTAKRLRDVGFDVLVIEAREIGAGTSGGNTGKITYQHGLIYADLIKRFGVEKAKMYLDANMFAVDEYSKIIDELKIDCNFIKEPAYVYSDVSDKKIIEEYEAVKSLGLNSRILNLSPVKFSMYDALRFNAQAHFDPKKFLFSLANYLIDKGVTIIEGERVINIKEKTKEKNRIKVTTNKMDYFSEFVVVATLLPILDHSYFSFRVIPKIHYGVAFKVSKKEFRGVYIKAEDPTKSFRYYEDMLIVISESFSMGLEGYNSLSELELERYVEERFDVDGILYSWSAHDVYSIDGVPFIGTYTPFTKKIFTATGFGGWGISHSMVASKIISDQIRGKENPWLKLYTPWRLKLPSDMGSYFSHIGKTIKQLVSSKPRCTHMGCSLKKNLIDNTYDCPCHGSRFDKEGNVLSGPAVKKIKLK